MKKILGMGNALTDILLQIDNEALLTSLHLMKGGMQLVDTLQSAEISRSVNHFSKIMVTGGSASNTINGIAKLRGKAGFVGKIGADEVGTFFKNDTIQNGVTPILFESNSPSGRCTVLITPDSERTLCTFLGASSEMTASDLTIDMFQGYDIFHIEGYLVQDHELIRQAVNLAKQAGLTVSLDLASYNVVEENLDFLQEIISQFVDIVFANEEEARAFTKLEPDRALHQIAEICDIAVVKVGKEGSLIKSGEVEIKIKPRLAKVVDTTGAGDLYAAGFLFGLANDYSLETCGNIGSLLSGNVIEVIGAKMNEQTWDSIFSELDTITSIHD
jgi:sugar/nucleoside kinase (ribokinase family)